MPPFRLEPLERQVRVRKTCILFTKGTYRPEVKNTDWEKYQESLPKDNDPYCPGNLNYHLSHYNRIGNGPEEPFETTTYSTTEQVHARDSVRKLFHIPNKYMVNYYTYNNTLACDSDARNKICPETCAASYSTTMQKSYKPPHPYVMERLSFPKAPFLLHRRYKWKNNAQTSPHTFYDEREIDEIKQIQCIKRSKMISYNPLTALNSDGSTPPTERNQRCVEMDYNKYK
ncbi:hypothetical protein PPYR_09636 [Photinus pyralis]|uniref:Uncharacterized protein n=1 Tax=Photinus pyralis TaxID=7054 RepID=A0A1Y1M9J9_PHOPY|nr:uncharacterized protein LOC116172832 [Photinus pyralis]KAB0798643.1 hypothetical protein PPYR_09636 [Photinus pyralis]